jgi:hypothetical protein
VRRVLTAALAATLLTASAFAGTSAAAPTAGRWAITSRGDGATLAQLRLEYSESGEGGFSRSSWSWSVAPAELGLSAERLRGAIAAVTFQIQREPGTFSCTGSLGEGSGAGQFTYAPNDAFESALAERGFVRPTYGQSLELAIAATTLAFVDQIRSSAPRATVADLLRLVQHGVTPRYVAELAALGYRITAVDQLIALRDHGVSVAFVGRLRAHGYTNLSIRDLIRLHDAGI